MSDALIRTRQAVAQQLQEKLEAIDVPWTELKELQERLQLIDRVIASQRAAADRRPARVMAPMVLVAVVLTLAATMRVPVVPVSMELQAGSATLDLAARSTIGPLALHGRSHVEGVAVLESPDDGLMRQFVQARANGFALDANEAMLRGLEVPALARVTFQAVPAGIQLRAELPSSPTSEPVHIDLDLSGRSVLDWNDGDPPLERDFGTGEWLRASSTMDSSGRAPVQVVLSLNHENAAMPLLSGLQPTSLRFAERRDSGQAVAKLSSSLEGGSLTLPATGETIPIVAGDWLEIDGFVAERCEVVLGSPMRWRLNGSASELRLRVGTLDRSLKPSWLEYLARHHLAQLLWGSAAVLWGALSWIQGRLALLP